MDLNFQLMHLVKVSLETELIFKYTKQLTKEMNLVQGT